MTCLFRRVCAAVVLACLSGSSSGCGFRIRAEKRQSIATIGGVPIFLDDFVRHFHVMRLQEDDAGKVPREADAAQKRALLDDLIDRRLMQAEAVAKSLVVTHEEVDNAFRRLSFGYGEDAFLQVLRGIDLTPAEVKLELQHDLLVQRYLQEEVFARVAVTDQDIETYVHTHHELLEVPLQVHLKQILLKAEEDVKKVQGEISLGLPFEDAAQKYSVGANAKGGGDMGFVTDKNLPQGVGEACLNLAVGEVSAPVTTPFGVYLFKAVEKSTPRALTLADVRDHVEALIRRERESESLTRKLKELRDQSPIVVQEERFAQVL